MAKFKKGQSGNPGGRPKENNDVKELARTYTNEAIEKLVYWMRTEEPKASVQACLALLDRGYGKPAQYTEVSGSLEIEDTSDMELARSIAFLLNKQVKEKKA